MKKIDFFIQLKVTRKVSYFKKDEKSLFIPFSKCYTVVFFTFKYFKMWAFELLSYLPVIRGFSAEKIKY